jgi:hypothetical protein
MPNWCDNKVKLEGPVDKIYDMVKPFRDNQLLQHLVPLEPEWDYDLAINTWGTKWDVSDAEVSHNVEDGVIEGYFLSAWGPPTEAFETYMLENPDVIINHSYYEGGNDFCGVDGEHRDSLPAYQDPLWDNDEVLKECNEQFGIRDSMEEWEDE